MRRWWPGKRGTMTITEIEFRVGGRWRYGMVTYNGAEVIFSGEFREIGWRRADRLHRSAGRPARHGSRDDGDVQRSRWRDDGLDPHAARQPAGSRCASPVHGRWSARRRLSSRTSRKIGGFSMRTVIYSMSVSLDGFIAGPDGSIDFAVDESMVIDTNLNGKNRQHLPDEADEEDDRDGRPRAKSSTWWSIGSGSESYSKFVDDLLMLVRGSDVRRAVQVHAVARHLFGMATCRSAARASRPSSSRRT